MYDDLVTEPAQQRTHQERIDLVIFRHQHREAAGGQRGHCFGMLMLSQIFNNRIRRLRLG